MSSSSSSSHAIVTYTSMSDNSDRPSFGIPLVDVYGYGSDASEAAPQSPEHPPLSPDHAPEHALLANDNLEPAKAQALPTPVLPAPLLPDYLAESEPIEDGPQEAEEYPEEDPSKEELPAPTSFILAIADPASTSKEIEPFEEDEIDPTSSSPISSHAIIPLS
nr:hypothetical protein [Tanacetum cinerariifolium]